MKLKLISFKLCPYTQMALLLARKNKLLLQTEYISQQQPPSWLEQKSPTAAVPILEVDERQVIFNSATIVEFLNEISDVDILPKSPINRAKDRAWMSFGQDLLPDLFNLARQQDKTKYIDNKNKLTAKLEIADYYHSDSAFFSGADFSLADVGFTPFLMRLDWINNWTNNSLDILTDNLVKWQRNILAQDFVADSVSDDNLEDIYMSMVEQIGGVLASEIV